MPFTQEIKQAAENLGKHLGADPNVQGYVDLLNKIRQDPEVAGLESQLANLYGTLIERQQNGETLQRSETDVYYRLKTQVEEHPLFAAREYQLEYVKAFFAQTAQHITAVLGIDYAALASQADEK